MIAWIARDRNGNLHLFGNKPEKKYLNHNTSDYPSLNPKPEFEHWTDEYGKIKLHPNTHKDVKPGECKQVTVKIK